RRFSDLPEALAGNEDLAGVLRSDVLPSELILPPPRVPRQFQGNVTAQAEYLERLCTRALERRGLEANLAARDRLRAELNTIREARLAGYFLTVRGISKLALRRRHTMALRGSAGNSLVCYLLGITNVDPLKFNLPTDRFLHPGRCDLPDIDLDFDWKVRDSVIDGVIRRYWAAHVARISTHLF